MLSRVTHAFTRTATALVDLTIRDAEGVTTTITGTPEHPFYVPAAGDYVPMGQLVAGTALRTLDGRAATVVAVAVRRARVTVYNFEVAETHTYFVAGSQGGAGVWVHNAKCNPDASQAFHDSLDQTVIDKIPESFGEGKPANQGIGWRWLDPRNPSGYNIRIDKGDPSGALYQHVDHVHITYEGAVRGRAGLPAAPLDHWNRHIPLSEWIKWRAWYTP